MKSKILGLSILCLLLSSCSNNSSSLIKTLSSLFSSSDSISGSALMFASSPSASSASSSIDFSATSGQCSNVTARLYSLDENDHLSSQPLMSVPVNSSGRYEFKNLAAAGIETNSSYVRHVVKVQGCGDEYSRPLTANSDQDITLGSTLLTASIDVTNASRRMLYSLKKSDVFLLLSNLSLLTGTTLAQALTNLVTIPSQSHAFLTVTNFPATELSNLPPREWNVTGPLSLQEMTPYTYGISLVSWNGSYQAAYRWTLDGVVVSNSSTWNYTPSANSQGDHTLVIEVGTDNGSGQILSTAPTLAQTYVLNVANSILPSAPSFSVIGSSVLSSRTVHLTMNTGTSMANCASFSTLAISENQTTPPASSAFSIVCSQSSSQAFDYQLTSAGDGGKTLRLWAKDASGTYSTTALPVSVTLDTVVPTVVISEANAFLTNSPSQVFSFLGADSGAGIDRFECQWDSGSWTPCSSPASTSSLLEGDHVFKVRAVDLAGNLSSVETRNWHIDLTLPVLNLATTPAAMTNALSAAFTLTATDSGGGAVSTYECQMDGGGWSACLASFSYVMLAGSHTLQARVRDTAGNLSLPKSYSWTIDSTAPTVQLSGTPPSLGNSPTGNFSFVGTDTGGGSVASYFCALDGSAFSSCVSPKSYSSLSDGAHVFSVKAVDTAGNVGTETTYSWTIDSSTPMASINSMPSNITNQTTAAFSFTANPPPSGSIVGYECNLDGGGWISCSTPKSYPSLGQGSHTFQVRSIDNNSNRSAATSASWLIDLTAPTATVVPVGAGVTNISSAVFNLSATDSGGGSIAGLECRLDSGSYAPCSGSISFSNLLQASHTISVRATDSAGNVSPVVTSNWIVDLTAPTVSFSTTPSSVTNLTSGLFAFAATDTGGGSVAGYLCSLDGAAFATCTSPQNLSSLSAAAHSFAVKAIDTAGNLSSPVASNWVIDTVAPSLAITLTPAILTNATSASFSFSGSDLGGGSIADYKCKIDGGSFATCSSPAVFSSLSHGAHSFSVTATDTAGNTNAAQVFSWTVDTSAPVLTISTPASNGSVIPVSSLSAFTVGGACSEEGVSVQLSGASSATASCAGGIWSASLNLASLADGTLSLVASQTDGAGNSGSSSARTFVKDTVAPTIIVNSTGLGATPSSSASARTISLSGTDVIEYKAVVVNGTSCTGADFSASSAVGIGTTFSFTPTPTRNHIVCAVGKDTAGNWQAVPVASSVLLVTGSASSTTTTLTSSGTVTADGISVASVTITIRDSGGNVLSGVVPTYSVSGTSNTLSACGSSNASGVSTCTFTSTKAESKTVSLVSPTTLSLNPSTIFVNGPASQIVFLTQASSTANVGQGFSVQPLLKLYDQYNNPVTTGPDATALITLTSATGTGQPLTSSAATPVKAAASGVADFGSLGVRYNLSGTKTLRATKADTTASAGGSASLTVSGTSIVVSDPQINFSLASKTVVEGSAAVTVTANLSFASPNAVSVPLTVSGTAVGAGTNYVLSSTTLSIPAGQTSGIVTITPVKDVKYAPAKTVILTMGSPSGATVGTSNVFTLTMTEADPVPTLTLSSATAISGNNLNFSASLNQASETNILVSYATTNGSAMNGVHYTGSTGTLTIPAGQTSGSISIATLDAGSAQGNFSMTLNLSSPVGAVLASSSVVGLIYTMNYNFMSGSLPTGVTFARGSNASYIDCSSGTCLINTAASGVPRFESDPVSKLVKGLLVEGPMTNPIIQSEALENSGAWVRTNLAVTANTTETTSPSGDYSAEKFVVSVTGAGSPHFISQTSLDITPGTFVTASVYVKPASGSYPRTLIMDVRDKTNSSNGFWSVFDLYIESPYGAGMGNIGSLGRSASYGMEPLGNGWFRCWISGIPMTSGGSNQATLNLYFGNGGWNKNYAGDGVSAAYLWGAQLENGTSFPTSYIKTVGSAASRLADSVSVSGFSLGSASSWYANTRFARPQYEVSNQSFSQAASPALFQLCASSDCANNRLSVNYKPSSFEWEIKGVGAGTTQNLSTTNAGELPTNETSYQLAVVNNSGTIDTVVNGSQGTTTSFVPSSYDTLTLGNSSAAGSQLQGHLQTWTLKPVGASVGSLVNLTKNHLPVAPRKLGVRGWSGGNHKYGVDSFENWTGLSHNEIYSLDFLWGTSNWYGWQKSLYIAMFGWQQGLASFNTTFCGSSISYDFTASMPYYTGGDANRKIVLAVPMIPSTGGLNPVNSLASMASGTNDVNYQCLASGLVNSYGGVYSNVILRLGWEMHNAGDGWPWRANGDTANYTAAFRRAVDVMRAVPGGTNLKIDWNPAWGPGAFKVEEAYPGDAYVDYVGLDAYDYNPYGITDPYILWQFYLKTSGGLYWHRRFANSHGKAMSYPEWATGNTTSFTDNTIITGGGGDNPLFIRQMYHWMKNNNVIYHGYWNRNGGGYNGRLDDTDGNVTAYPNAAAEFLKYFGAP